MLDPLTQATAAPHASGNVFCLLFDVYQKEGRQSGRDPTVLRLFQFFDADHSVHRHPTGCGSGFSLYGLSGSGIFAS
ncbi:MAG: hypothetical protein P8X63_10345, partial [Desulfuromonadaceae bacterium]